MENSSALTSTKQTVSYSRLSTYTECPAKYRNKYVNKIDVVQPIQDYFILGNLTHSCIEDFLMGSDKEAAIDLNLAPWLEDKCLLNVGSEGIDIELLSEYAREYAQLLSRTSPMYKGDDPIRNNDGSYCKDPINYPPAVLKDLYRQTQLPQQRRMIDDAAATLSNTFRRISLADTTAKALLFFYNFEVPDWVDETVGIEYDIAAHSIGWTADINWNGAIDWIVKNKDGAVILIDHKTSKTKPEGIDVAWHPQLNLYAHIYYEITGHLVDYIAINHLPSGQLIISEVSSDIVQSNLEHWQGVQKSIDRDKASNHFQKQLPTDYGSKCIDRDYRTKQLSKVCPYLRTCHADYAFTIQDELRTFEAELN